jgi:adenylosuccinate synthase
LQEVGHEYGTTTGRRRRCGWLDLVQLRYSNQVNGYTSLNLTKLDVLDNLSEIKVAIKYMYQGEELPYFPADLNILEKVQVEYVTFKGWKSKTSDCTLYSQLPAEAKIYVESIEQLLGVRIQWIGVGPGRDRMLTR